MVQVLINIDGQRTVCYHHDGDSVELAQVLANVEEKEGIPSSFYNKSINGRAIDSVNCLLTADFENEQSIHLRLNLNLVGGKGGFGSMLRALGAQRSGAETDNIDACRDINGRRLRDVEDEKKLVEWLAQSDEREKEAQRRRQLKKERALRVPKHNFDHHQLAVELDAKAKEVEDSVRQGMQAAMAAAVVPSQAGPSDSSSGSSDTEGNSSSNGSGKRRVADELQAKRPRLRTAYADDLSDDSSEGEVEADGEAEAGQHLPEKMGQTVDRDVVTETNKDESKSKQKQKEKPNKNDQKNNDNTDSTKKEHSKNNTEAKVKEVEKSKSEVTSKAEAQSKRGTKESSNKATPPAPAVEPCALDLSLYNSAKDLEELGLDRLKAGLMALGVKCGGSIEQRAERLFSLKGVAEKDIPAALRAKKK